jgi:UDP-N-acetylmuramoylalanine--D-glutamate ligase
MQFPNSKMDLKDKRVLVFGLGVHGGGLGVARWLVKQDAQVTVTDIKRAEELQPSLDALRGLRIEYVLGEHREQDFANADLVVRNPAVPRESPWLKIAQTHGVPVEMEMGLFVERLPRGTAQVIGITGTKGKTTTTLMVGEILKRVNPKTVVAGNLRVSALELLDQIDADTPVILELSSWQLEGLEPHEASPHIAAITNISPDHLNRYRDMDDYAQAKSIIFRFQQPGDFVVLNFDSKLLTRLSSRAFGKVVWTSSQRVLTEGAFREGDTLVWCRGGTRQKIMNVSDLRMSGEHNIANALTAIALSAIWMEDPANSAGSLKVETIAAALTDLRGFEHRQELVREISGVRYINDTTATAPAAAIAAIEAFAPSAQNLVLIAGGADKGLEFADMARMIAKWVKQLILLEGTATDKLALAVQAAGAEGKIAGRFNTLREAVQRAQNVARSGDVILLSPGCASFGMFANEFERGDKFREIVNQL